MPYEGKTDWKYDDVVTERDLNRIEQCLVDVTDKSGDNEHRITVVEEQMASQSTKVTELKQRYILTENATQVPIGIPEFHRLTDSLTVILNSVVLTEGDQYEVSEDNQYIIGNFNGEEDVPSYFEFKVLKNFVTDLVFFDGSIIQDGTISKSKLQQNVQDQLDKIDNLDAENVYLESPNFTSTNVLGGLEELFQRGVDVKEGLVEKLSAMNVPATTSETIDELLLKILNVSKDANATTGQVLTGRSFYQGGERQNGAMPNRGNVNQTLTQQGQEYTVQSGYHGGGGRVRANISNLSPAVIKKSENVGGIIGTFTEKNPRTGFNASNSYAISAPQYTGYKFSDNTSSTAHSLRVSDWKKDNTGITLRTSNAPSASQYPCQITRVDANGNLISTISLPNTYYAGGILTSNDRAFIAGGTWGARRELREFDLSGNLIATHIPFSEDDAVITIGDIVWSERQGGYIFYKLANRGGLVNPRVGFYTIDGTLLSQVSGNYSSNTEGRYVAFLSEVLFLMVTKSTESGITTYVWRRRNATGNGWNEITTNYSSWLMEVSSIPHMFISYGRE
ncbi:hypothetical protein [Bacillus horti]|uniref:Uncharacterized protein n=1 Tax=Caldalkalibacillus horti TaxID=77523 RepID=A0ABT9W097_9BACI|nr:hypothetical protein [Bacillus horti]MDQ0166647.1 hypothetical protein [Bacillus horti]